MKIHVSISKDETQTFILICNERIIEQMTKINEKLVEARRKVKEATELVPIELNCPGTYGIATKIDKLLRDIDEEIIKAITPRYDDHG